MCALIGNRWYRKFQISRSVPNVAVLLVFLGFSTVWIVLYYRNLHEKPIDIPSKYQYITTNSDAGYLVNSAKCQIMNLNPFNEDALRFFNPQEYDSCTRLPLLTYMTHANSVAIITVDNHAISSYGTESVVCCYSNVTRKKSAAAPDDTITTTECQIFKDSVTLYHDTVTVKCFSEDRQVIYENAHSTHLINEDINQKLTEHHPEKQISVLLIGIDSISRLHFIRALPKTYNYVESNEWIPLKGYNKMEDNTFPNLMAVLTGFNSTDISDHCEPTELGSLDKCPMVWYQYKDLGYITSYAEDECSMSTFNFKKKGFTFPPTDFYFRPYMLASETLTTKKKEGMTYCTGPEASGERILNLAKDFAITFKENPHFGLFWTNTFSHNEFNTVSGMDDKLKEFLETLEENNVFEHSVVIFLSDHGIRFGDIRLTDTGWLEERLPFIYFSFPSWFKEQFRDEYENFKTNSDRLTSPYDLHMTLQHLLVLSGHDYTMSQSTGCSKCRSLLEEIDEDRSCEEAGIEQHWCTCSGYTRVSLNKNIRNSVSAYVLSMIHRIIASYDEGRKCKRYVVKRVISTSFSQKMTYTNKTYLLLKFETEPKAVFESTIRYEGDISDLKFSISGGISSGISRLDRYFKHSNCVRNADLKKYCYCA